MSDLNMRDAIIKAYSGEKWKSKVLSMPSEQIVALYFSLQRRGKIK